MSDNMRPMWLMLIWLTLAVNMPLIQWQVSRIAGAIDRAAETCGGAR